MASVWFWLFVPAAAIIAGIVFSFIIYFVFAFLKDVFVIKRKIPRNKKKVSEYIKENPDLLANPGKEEINEEEEKKNAKRQRNKYREFAKLRRLDLKKRTGRKGEGNRGTESSARPSKPTKQPSGKRVLPAKSGPSNPEPRKSDSSSRPRVKLDS